VCVFSCRVLSSRISWTIRQNTVPRSTVRSLSLHESVYVDTN